MITYLFENPIPLLMVGAVLFTFVAVLHYSTRSLGSFIGMILVGVCMLSGLVMEQLVYTEREQVEVVLSGITDAAEANDQARVLSFLSPTADETRKMVEKLMPQFEIEKANIMSDIEITLDDEKAPTSAVARFRGFFYANHKGGMAGGKPFPVEVELRKQDNRWLIESFTSTSEDFESEAARLMN